MRQDLAGTSEVRTRLLRARTLTALLGGSVLGGSEELKKQNLGCWSRSPGSPPFA
jgi:hypothetical protein